MQQIMRDHLTVSNHHNSKNKTWFHITEVQCMKLTVTC